MPILITIMIIVALLLLAGVLMYNGLVNKRNRLDQNFSMMDVMLKRRHDLIPNLVASVQQFMAHERSLLTEITELRAQATQGALSSADRTSVENQLSGALGRLMAVAENYPQLTSSPNFIQLQRTLTDIEEQLSAVRRTYNTTVTEYNNALQMFPTNLIASMMGLQPREWFIIPEAERANVDVGALFRR